MVRTMGETWMPNFKPLLKRPLQGKSWLEAFPVGTCRQIET